MKELDGASTEDLWYTDPIDIYSLSDINMSKAGYMKLKWTSDDNLFLFDYTENLVNEMWILARLYKFAPKTETVLFSNDEQTIKLKESVKRTLEFEATDINENLTEVLTVAMAHQYFYVNDIQFVAEEEIEIVHKSNLVDVKAILTQTNVIGLNTIGLTEPENDFTMNYVINPVQLGYVPTATGNTLNLGEWVTDSNGNNWIIDFDGRAKQWTGAKPLYEDFDGITVNYVTPTNTLPSSEIDEGISVFLNGQKLNYSGGTSAGKPKEYGVDLGTNRIYFYDTLSSTDLVEVYITNY